MPQWKAEHRSYWLLVMDFLNFGGRTTAADLCSLFYQLLMGSCDWWRDMSLMDRVIAMT